MRCCSFVRLFVLCVHWPTIISPKDWTKTKTKKRRRRRRRRRRQEQIQYTFNPTRTDDRVYETNLGWTTMMMGVRKRIRTKKKSIDRSFGLVCFVPTCDVLACMRACVRARESEATLFLSSYSSSDMNCERERRREQEEGTNELHCHLNNFIRHWTGEYPYVIVVNPNNQWSWQ